MGTREWTALNLNPQTPTPAVALEKLLNLAEPQVLHLENKENISIHLRDARDARLVSVKHTAVPGPQHGL